MSALPHLRWSRINPDLPPGIHRPKKHGDVGYDLEAMEDVIIPPMGIADVPVNAEVELPPNMWAAIRNRSSMGRRHLYVDQNVIDNGYRGPLYVLIRNMQLPSGKSMYLAEDGAFVHSTYQSITFTDDTPWDRNTIRIAAGDRIGQLVFHQMSMVRLSECEEIRRDTDRAASGFGSTGV